MKLFYLPTANNKQNLTILADNMILVSVICALSQTGPLWRKVLRGKENTWNVYPQTSFGCRCTQNYACQLVSCFMRCYIESLGKTGGVPLSFSKERNTVLRFMGQLSRRITSPDPRREIFTIILGDGDNLELKFRPEFGKLHQDRGTCLGLCEKLFQNKNMATNI